MGALSGDVPFLHLISCLLHMSVKFVPGLKRTGYVPFLHLICASHSKKVQPEKEAASTRLYRNTQTRF